MERLTVERRYFLAGRRKVTSLPNLTAEIAVFLVTRYYASAIDVGAYVRATTAALTGFSPTGNKVNRGADL